MLLFRGRFKKEKENQLRNIFFYLVETSLSVFFFLIFPLAHIYAGEQWMHIAQGCQVRIDSH